MFAFVVTSSLQHNNAIYQMADEHLLHFKVKIKNQKGEKLYGTRQNS